jgi:hypothetical protein
MGLDHLAFEANGQHVWTWFHNQLPSVMRWKRIKRSQGPQGKNLFQNYPWHLPFLCWFITSNFVFWIFILTLHVRYKYILITNWLHVMYIMHSCPLSHKYENFIFTMCVMWLGKFILKICILFQNMSRR